MFIIDTVKQIRRLKMTLRGYRKNLVVIKNPDGKIIDEAFFLLKDGACADEGDIVREANMIIEHSKEMSAIKNTRQRFALPEFFIGAALAAIVALAMFFAAGVFI